MTADTVFISVVGIDIEGYSKKEIAAQMAAQKDLERFVIAASVHAKIKRDGVPIAWIDTGDGGFLITQEPYNKIIPFLDELYSQINQHNAGSNASHKLYARAAVHCADVVRWSGEFGPRYAGNAVNVCARILDGMSRNYHCQIVCSDAFVRKLMTTEKLVDAVRLSDQEDKHHNKHPVWNIALSPRFGVSPNSDDLHPDPNEWHLT